MKLILFLLIPVALVAQIPNPFGGGGGAGGAGLPLPLGSNGTCLTITGGVAVWGSCSGSGNPGTVTSVGITSLPAWLTGSVATGTSTPAITLAGATGLTSHQFVGTCGSSTTAALCSIVAADLPAIPLTTGVTGILPVANGGTGTSSPALVAGTNVTITGSWPNQTINSSGGGGGTNVYTVDNVISDGAAGDCSTDDTAKLQAALDNTSTNVVYLPTPTTCYLTSDVLLGRSNQTVIGASRPASGLNGGIKNNNSLASGIVWSNSGTVKGTYTSGITATGTTGQTCLLTAFNGTGGSGAAATIKLTGTNTIGTGAILNFTAYGSGYTGTSTSATVGNGTATCSGTPVLVTRIGQGARNVVVQNLNVTDSAVSRTAGNGIVFDGTGSAANFHVYDSHVQGFENGIDVQVALNSGIQNVRGDSQLNDFIHVHGSSASTGMDLISDYGDAPANFCYYASIMNYSSLVATSCDAAGSDAYHFETADGGQSRGLRLQIGTESPTGHGLYLDASGVTVSNPAITGVPTGKSDIYLNGADTVTIDGGYLTGGDYAVNVNADPGHGGNLSSLHIVNPPHASGQGTATYKDTNNRLVYLSDLNPSIPCNDTSGSGTTQVCNTNQSFTPVSGNAVLYSTTTSNTGDVTVNVNSLGAKHIRKWSGASTLALGDLVANVPVVLVYDGTYWEIQTIGNSPAGSGTVTVVSSGSLTSTDCVTGGGAQTIQTPSSNCTVDSSGNLDANSLTTTGSAAGTLSLTNNSTAGTVVNNSWGWTAPGTITTSWYGEAPNSSPTSNQIMLFGAPSSNVSQWAWTNFTIAGMGSTAHNVEAPLVCADSSGSGTAQLCTTSPTFTPASGDAILYSTTTTNTGDVTLNVNSSAAKHIRKWSASSTLASGDLVANTPVLLIYDGTYWEISTIGNAPGGSGTVTSIATTSPITGGTITSSGTIACATCVTSAASLTSTDIMTGAGSQASQTPSNNATVDSSGNLKAASLVATGRVDGTATINVTTGSTLTFGTTGTAASTAYYMNQNATAATAITGTLPTAAAGLQYCIANSYNGSAANTGTLEILTSTTGQFIIFTDGTLSATGGYVISAGAARDAACVVGVDSTHWMLFVNSGTWTKH